MREQRGGSDVTVSRLNAQEITRKERRATDSSTILEANLCNFEPKTFI